MGPNILHFFDKFFGDADTAVPGTTLLKLLNNIL